MRQQTFKPKVRRRQIKHGFLHRMSTKAGRRVLRRRATKGRRNLSA